MKHKIKLLALSILLMISGVTASAKEIVEVVFPFPLLPQFGHSLLSKVNNKQDKWEFVLVLKPGAGGGIAANYVMQRSAPSILFTNSSFFIRPTLYESNPYKISDFDLLSTQCALPLVVVSNKYKTIKEVKPNDTLNIAVTGVGSTSHLVALLITERYPNSVIVPFNGVPAAITSALAGDTNMSIGFIKQLEPHFNTLSPLGITGDHTISQLEPLEKAGIRGSRDITNNFFLAVPVTVSPEIKKEWQELFASVNSQKEFKEEYCTPIEFTDNWYKDQAAIWKSRSAKITQPIR